uniref:Conserved hypothetical plastid protein n=1 Tax=Mastocarpus papillatus TaxID=31436 RepID=A0A342RZC1_9FLOR|nr:conserved hypothetical plastid protein [Mastocarpus papillatus]AOL58067.1 conserved hypothetical plastid protein [Mastocarpus papillatus]
MNQKLNLKQRLDFILITAEALDLYALTDEKKLYTLHTYNILLIKFGNYIRHADKSSKLQFKQQIKFIQFFYTLVNKSYLHNLALEILNDSCNKKKSLLTVQYIHRFTYIYNQTQDYYNTYSKHKDLKIDNIAITNLYVINKICSKYGVFFLIKYLYN